MSRTFVVNRRHGNAKLDLAEADSYTRNARHRARTAAKREARRLVRHYFNRELRSYLMEVRCGN